MTLKNWFPLVVLVTFLTACTPFPGDPDDAAMPAGRETPFSDPETTVQGDESMQRGKVEITSMAILVSGSFPPQYQLEVKGSLPTPCHTLRSMVDLPILVSEIRVQVFSVYDPYTVCSQVAKPFDASIPLGSYVRGSYPLFVNDQEVGEITP